jgi:hypothetical protein
VYVRMQMWRGVGRQALVSSAMRPAEPDEWLMDDVLAHLHDRVLDEGLVVERVWEERHDGRRIIFAEYRHDHADVDKMGFWWDVDAEPGWAFDDATEVATYLRIWLEEAYNAGPALQDRPKDRDGLTWVCPGLPAAALPPGR